MEIDTRMMLPLFGSSGVSNEDFTLLAAIGTLQPHFSRGPGEFAAAADKARGEYHQYASQLGKWLDQAVAEYSTISYFIEENRNSEAFGESVEDIENQIAWLLRKNFLLQAGWERAQHYPRYFRGISERIQRLQSHPIMRDLEKMDRVLPFVEDWQALCDENPESIEIRDLGYAVEELRISLFAPSVPTGMKISEKRMGKMLEVIGNQ